MIYSPETDQLIPVLHDYLIALRMEDDERAQAILGSLTPRERYTLEFLKREVEQGELVL